MNTMLINYILLVMTLHFVMSDKRSKMIILEVLKIMIIIIAIIKKKSA